MDRVATSYLGMSWSKEEDEAPLLGGGALTLGLGRGGAGAQDGGMAGRVDAGACRVVTLVGGTGSRVGAGASGGGAATLCDRSRMGALIGSRVPRRAVQVGMEWTAAWMVPNWVVMVSS